MKTSSPCRLSSSAVASACALEKNPLYATQPANGKHHWLGREHVPDDVGSLQIRILAIAAVIGQSQLAARELADAPGQFETPLEHVGGLRVGDHLARRTRRAPELRLAAQRLRVVAEGLAPRQCDSRENEGGSASGSRPHFHATGSIDGT